MTVNILSENKFIKEHLLLRDTLLSKNVYIKDYGPYTKEHITTFETLLDGDNQINPFKQIQSDFLKVLQFMYEEKLHNKNSKSILLIISDNKKIKDYIYSSFFTNGFYNLHCLSTKLDIIVSDDINFLLNKI